MAQLTIINNKKYVFFIIFDICEFYPSIIEELLLKAQNYTKTLVNINDEDMEIFLQAKKSFL